MNRNSIRRATTCCLTAAVVLTSTPLMAHAAVSAGAGNLIAAAEEAGATEKQGTDSSATAGISKIIASSLNEEPEVAADTSIQDVQNEVPVKKSEYDDIAIAQVDNYVNVDRKSVV